MDEVLQGELKEVLLEEKKKLEERLESIGDKDENAKNNYNAEYVDMGDDEESNAFEVAEFSGRLDLEHSFEEVLQKIDKALAKMEKGTYGVCEKTGEKIPDERLKAIPWAETIADVDED